MTLGRGGGARFVLENINKSTPEGGGYTIYAPPVMPYPEKVKGFSFIFWSRKIKGFSFIFIKGIFLYVLVYKKIKGFSFMFRSKNIRILDPEHKGKSLYFFVDQNIKESPFILNLK